jgi:hypothetical protein
MDIRRFLFVLFECQRKFFLNPFCEKESSVSTPNVGLLKRSEYFWSGATLITSCVSLRMINGASALNDSSMGI